jgi:hypothetical protein
MSSPLSPSAHHSNPERKLPLAVPRPLRLDFLCLIYNHPDIPTVKSIPISHVFSTVVTNSFKMFESTSPYHLDSQMTQGTHSPPSSVNSIGHEEGQSHSMVQEENASLSEVVPTEVYLASTPSSPNFGTFRSLIAESEASQFPQPSETRGSPEMFSFGQLEAFDALQLNPDFPGHENSDLPGRQSSVPTEGNLPEMGLDTTPIVGFSYNMTSAPSYPGVQSQSMEFSSSGQMWVKF